eukprot:Tbor_TRINITY_DN4154_c0_g1::TRINITY_DN4154_c0_g1_i1::g.26496::m.26496
MFQLLSLAFNAASIVKNIYDIYEQNPFKNATPKRIDWRHTKYNGRLPPIRPYPIETPYTGGRVKGLFIGINYFGSRGELKGCINDVATMLDCLRKIKFPLEEVVILVDDPKFGGAAGPPTRDNIIRHMLWLVNDARPGDVLFFHYSGHGSRTRDLDGDEEDGYDETLVPVDHETAGAIIDDDIFEIMVRRLPGGVRMTCVMDCCHSGSLMDLPFTVVAGENMSPHTRMTAARSFQKRQSNGDVIQFSGCADHQTSADVSNVSSFGNPSYGSGGACTNALVQVLTRTTGLTYIELLKELRRILRVKKYTQVPQLASSKPIDMSKTFSLFGTIDAGTYTHNNPTIHQPQIWKPPTQQIYLQPPPGFRPQFSQQYQFTPHHHHNQHQHHYNHQQPRSQYPPMPRGVPHHLLN